MVRGACQQQSPPVVQIIGDQHLYAKVLRDGSHEDETLLYLQSILPPHHLPVRHSRSGDVLFLESVPSLFPSIRSFHDVLRRVDIFPLKMFQSMLAQIVALLILAHSCDATFAHNDFKADNILVTRADCEGPLVIGDVCVRHEGVRVVWIDVETATCAHVARTEFPSASKEALEVFGMAPDLEWCEWTDLHLLLMECLVAVSSRFPPWDKQFTDFLRSSMPINAFKTFKQGNRILVTSMNRLSRKGREAFNEMMEAGSVMHLRQLLQQPFLATVAATCSVAAAAQDASETSVEDA
jgi:serine/threonine protein kinase